ncbi:hypothetical protein MCHLDSM_03809 [Mycolicibacterium chlorophenolicum]|uniref:Uncharacterized protein n=1 Tax=Mycolicibacterium chlorophenolicum TaxID=37916 RepID=A0A0J6VVD3_9MYCO|nr:hypothetical protein MCHLDSM_03809 [Mycolicibacterium chlorophenolicum]
MARRLRGGPPKFMMFMPTDTVLADLTTGRVQ